MFKKLKRKFLLINMATMSFLLITCFSVIFFMTYNNTNHNIQSRLDRFLTQHPKDGTFHTNDKFDFTQDNPDNPENPPNEDISFDRNTSENRPPDFSSTFTVVTDLDGNVLEMKSNFSLYDDFDSDKISKIALSKNDTGHIKTSIGSWEYKRVPKNTGYAIAFAEISAEQSMLNRLLIILLSVFIVSLLIVYFISLLFADRAIKPVEESFDKQKQFVADASHELKTPLTTINTNVDVLLSHENNTILDERKWLVYIQDETKRMTKLTNDLLYLAKLDHNDNNIMYQIVSFSDAIENVILTMEAVLFEKDIKLEYNIAPDIFVLSSSDLLKQLVMILLDNAIKYTKEQGSITLNLTSKQQEAKLTVTNTGDGISEKDAEHIFDRFYRLDKSRARESGGYGLGLAIAKAITESSRGTIGVTSKINEYTTFYIKLPITTHTTKNM